jgi:hypothetical protein
MTTMTWLEREFWSQPRPVVPQGRVENSAQISTAPKPPDVLPAARFERHGSELVLVVPISATEAQHGALIKVPAPGTSVRLRVPPGTISGRRFRVPRVNAPAPDGFGDLTVVVQVA